MKRLFSFSFAFSPNRPNSFFLFHPAAQKPFPAAHFPCAGPFSLPAQPVSLPFPPSLTDVWDPLVIPDLGEDSDSPRVRVERAPP